MLSLSVGYPGSTSSTVYSVLAWKPFSPVHDHAGLAEECRLSIEILAGLAGQEEIDLLQMVGPVVAGDAT